MDSKLKIWLNSLPPEERSKMVEKLGAVAIETKDEKMMNVIRKAAGLPDLEVNPYEDKVEAAARKAAGLR